LTGASSVGGLGSKRLVLSILGVDSRDPHRIPDGDGTSPPNAGDASFASFKAVVGDSERCCGVGGRGIVKRVLSSLLLSSFMIP
jgi:hypothetical protein